MNRILKIAHRGYSGKYPENTMPSFEKAIEQGADMIELDVHLSRDGHPVVIHDDFVDRTSNGSGMVKDLSLEELREFNYCFNFSELGHVLIPTLDEVIEIARGRVKLNIEIKNCPVRYPGIEKKIVEVLKDNDFMEDAVVSSFDHYALYDIKKIEPSLKTGMLYDAVWFKFWDEVEQLKAYSVHPNVDVVHDEQLELAKKNGIKIYAWVARDTYTVKRLTGSGYIDGIMVDDLELLDL